MRIYNWNHLSFPANPLFMSIDFESFSTGIKLKLVFYYLHQSVLPRYFYITYFKMQINRYSLFRLGGIDFLFLPDDVRTYLLVSVCFLYLFCYLLYRLSYYAYGLIIFVNNFLFLKT